MRCMRCGVKIDDQLVFCESCLSDIEKYPVKPGATVQIPVRPAPAPVKKRPRRNRDLKPEEQLRRAKLTIRYLCATLAVLVIAFALTAALLLRLLNQRDLGPGIGQNYTTVITPGK